MNEELCFLPATALLAHYAKGTLSPVEVTQAVLTAIDAVNPAINAYNLVDGDAAIASAQASEARWRTGAPMGALDGVPTSIKDLLLTRGWPTLRGSLTVDAQGPWQDDAPCVARLREQGAVLLGKTTTPEFGWKGVTDSPLSGVTRNPWDLQRTPGGSSGGAAAALAAGLGALAVGTDGGGSIRIPCGFTGVFGIKASFGRVPAWPASPMGTLSHVGPMARSVADAALMLSAMAAPDHRDWMSLPPAPPRWLDDMESGIQGMRVAFSGDLGYAKVDPEVAAIVAEAAAVFEALGAHVEAVDPGFSDPTDIFRRHWWVGAAKALAPMPEEKKALLEGPLRQVVEEGAKIPLLDYMAAIDQRMHLGQQMRAFHQKYDLLLTPALAVPAFTAGQLAPADRQDDNHWVSWTPFTYPFNLSQQPACAINCGFTTAGLPVGLQIVADNYREDLVLRAAYAFEQSRPAIAWPVLA